MATSSVPPTVAPKVRVRIEVFPSSQSASLDFYTRVLRFSRPPSPFPSQPRPNAVIDKEAGDKEPEEYIHVTRGAVVLGLSWSAVDNYHPLAKDFKQRYALRDRPLGTELVLGYPTIQDLHAERAHILKEKWPLDDDLELRPWGLWDFRVKDPDGYYWRLTTEESESESTGGH